MSDLVHVSNSLVCPMPEVEFHPNRNAFDAKRSLRNFWSALESFGQQYCIFGCAQCEGRLEKKNKDAILWRNSRNYLESFNHAHDVAGQLPDDVYRHLVSFANGKCPVCTILVALQQFPQIAKHSESPLFTELSVPCFWGLETDETGWNSNVIVRHVDALSYLDLDELPPKLTPADEHEIRELLVPGKAVIRFIQDIIEGKIQPSPMMTDDELWTILRWRKFLNDPALEITDAWEAWAKKSFMAGAKWSSNDVCRLILVAVDCYENLTKTGESIDGFLDGCGIEFGRLLEIFNSVACLCGDEMYDLKSFYDMVENWKSTFLSWDASAREKIYIALAIPGKLSAEKSCGKPPPFFQCDVCPQKDKGGQNTTVITQSATKSAANATGIGMGEGGKGGDSNSGAAAIVGDIAPKQDMTLNNAPVLNNHIPNPAEAIMATSDISERWFNKGVETGMKLATSQPQDGPASKKPSISKESPNNAEKADAAIWNEWEQAKAAKIAKAKFAADKGMTENEVQNTLDRHRKRLGR